MLKKLSVINNRGVNFDIPLIPTKESNFIITSIDGLGPSDATIGIQNLPTLDGGVFTHSRINSKKIDITLRYVENPDVETVRHETYKMFPIKQKVKLTVETDQRNMFIEGYVEKNRITMFSNKCQSVITLSCPRSYFVSSKLYDVIFSGVSPSFEFPFSNESMEPVTVLGEIYNTAIRNIIYDGEIKQGATFRLYCNGDVLNPFLYDISSGGIMNIKSEIIVSKTGSGLIKGDEIIINTIRGERSINLLRSGTYYPMLNATDKTSSWFELETGDNQFAYYAEEGFENLELKIEYRLAYEGV